MSTTLDRAARAIERNWRGIWPADAHRMAVTLKVNGLLVPEIPDVALGVTIDEGGTRPESVSCSLRKESVLMVALGADGDGAVIGLRPGECRELGAWLLAAAAELLAIRCPECTNGKHVNCGPALNEATDKIVPCECGCGT